MSRLRVAIAVLALAVLSSAPVAEAAPKRAALFLTGDGHALGSAAYIPGLNQVDVGDLHKDGWSIVVEVWWKRGARLPQQLCWDTTGAGGTGASCDVKAPKNTKLWFYIAQAHKPTCKSSVGPCTKKHWDGPVTGHS